MLKQRVITALVLVAALIPILFLLPEFYAVAFFALIAALGAWEWSRLVSPTVSAHWRFPLWILACCAACWRYPQLQVPVCQLAAGFWMLVPVWLVWRWKLPHRLLGYGVGTIVLVPTWIAMTRLHAQGPWVLLAAMVLVWVADIAAYFVGRAIGRHKLAPAVSPGKTWEGAGGAVLGSMAYVFALQHFAPTYLPSNITTIALVTLLLVAVSVIGDLFESLIKRQAGVKDSSQLLPGHGGVLDRIDALTSTLPVFVVVSSFLTP